MFKFNLKLLIIPLAFLLLPLIARADICNLNTNVDFVARDPDGSYIANASVEIYKQEIDANGHAKPTTRFAGDNTDAVLGTANLSFRNGSMLTDTYAIKVQTVNKDSARFWYYNIILNCGQSVDIEKTLSGILFVLHDIDGNTLKNANFDVYSQLYDSSNNPLKEKKEKLATLNTGYSGQAKIYLPQGSLRSINSAISDHYALELNRSNVKFNYYNIRVYDGQLTNMDYYLSALRIRLQDSSGAVFPAGTKIEVYNQEVGPNNESQKGTKVGEFSLGSDGYGTFEVPTGLYVLAIKEQNNQYKYFWDIEAEDGRTTEYTLSSDQTWTSFNGTCQNNSQFTLTLRNLSGDIVPGLKFELYEQSTDANGLPIAGRKVGGGTIANTGQATLNFRPDPTKSYAIKVWDRRSDLGDFWFFDSVRFVCDYNRSLIKYVPALRLVLRDSQGNLKRNFNFSLYSQNYDVDNNPVKEDKNLIANLTTDSGGQATVYVAPYNPYRRGQTGIYAVSAKDSNNNYSTAYNIRVLADRDYTFEYTFSGFSGELRDARSRLQTNKEIKLYEQLSSSDLGRELLKTKTNDSGRFSFEYPAGVYALAINDDFNRPNIFWNVTVKSANANQRITTNVTNFGLADTQGESIPREVSLKIYTLVRESGNTFYQDKEVGTVKLSSNKTGSLSLAAGPYLVTYVGQSGREYGQAFYAQNGLIQTVSVIVNSKYLISNNQKFTLSIPNSSSVSSSSSSTNSSSNSGSLSARLRGRILLQVQDKGQAWYINPDDNRRYYLGRPADAFNLMRRFGLGISNSDFAAVERNPNSWSRLAGKILIKVEDNGRAYYFDPTQYKLYYLGRPADAFNLMRQLGLGITDSDLNKITAGN